MKLGIGRLRRGLKAGTSADAELLGLPRDSPARSQPGMLATSSWRCRGTVIEDITTTERVIFVMKRKGAVVVAKKG